MSKKPPQPLPEQTPEGIMAVLAKSCQEQSGAIAHLVAKPEFEPQFWMTTALDDLDAALHRLVAVVHQYSENPADAR
jgi:hypothetical protein